MKLFYLDRFGGKRTGFVSRLLLGLAFGGVSLPAVVVAEEPVAPLVSTGTELAGPEVPAGGQSEGPSPTTERPARKSPGLLRAARLFEEGVLAETQGDVRCASRKYARALKLFADRAEDTDLLALRPEIARFLNRAEPRSGEGFQTGELSLEDPEAPRVSTRTYAIRIDAEDPLVKKYVALYSGPWRERTQAAFDRMGPYLTFITRAIEEEKMPRELLYLPVVESEYQPFAVSRAGAVGLWQFMATTAKYAGLKVNYWVDERRDPYKSTGAALRTLKSLYDWFDDWALALAAYNRGIYGIQRDLEFTRSTDFSLLSKRQGLPTETEHYVPQWMALVLIGDNASAYGLRPPSPRSLPVPDQVALDRPLDLKVAAACAGVSETVIHDLNPSLRLWVTPGNELPFTLFLPSGVQARFLEELAKVKDWTPSPGFVRYTVQRGDFLGRIAKRFHTTPLALQRDNKMSNIHRLRPGQVLVVRPGRGFRGDNY